MEVREFINKLQKVKTPQEYYNLIKSLRLKCSNDVLLYTQESLVSNIPIIPLYYDGLFICFSFEEIFRDYFALLKKESYVLPDPLRMQKNISDINRKIIEIVDNKFNYGRLSREMSKKTIKLPDQIVNILYKFISGLKDPKKRDDTFMDFMAWYDREGHKYVQSSVIDNYKCTTESLCVKDLTRHLEKILQLRKTEKLDLIEEEDE